MSSTKTLNNRFIPEKRNVRLFESEQKWSNSGNSA